MIGAVKPVEAGRKAEEIARKMGVSKHTIDAWEQKYGGMDVSEAQEVRALRKENARLKRIVTDLSLGKDALQFVINKRIQLVGTKAQLRQTRADVGAIRAQYAMSER